MFWGLNLIVVYCSEFCFWMWRDLRIVCSGCSLNEYSPCNTDLHVILSFEMTDKDWNCFNLVNDIVWKDNNKGILISLFCGCNKKFCHFLK